MTSPLAELPLTGQLHLLLLRASGRLPDDVLVDLRWSLFEGRAEECASRLAAYGLDGQFPMSSDEIAVLGSCVPAGTALPAPAEQPVDTPPATPFIAVPPILLPAYGDFVPQLRDSTADPEGTDGYDQAVLDSLDLAETVGVWRSWRIDIDPQGNASAARIYVIEIDVATAELPAVAAGAQQALIDEGDRVSQVEVYSPGLPLPAYQWAARASSALIWAPFPATDIRIALVPAPDLPADPERRELSDPERVAALDYLRSAAAMTTLLPAPGLDGPALTLFTDGWWIWSDALADHLDRYGVVADPDLEIHLREAGFSLWEVNAVAAHRAMIALLESGSDAVVTETVEEADQPVRG